ncbi:UNVERIFIED_CONTAM: hypothetical protein FKN15_026071 [Acipenser sinensis]
MMGSLFRIFTPGINMFSPGRKVMSCISRTTPLNVSCWSLSPRKRRGGVYRGGLTSLSCLVKQMHVEPRKEKSERILQTLQVLKGDEIVMYCVWFSVHMVYKDCISFIFQLHNESMRECLSLLQRPPSRSKDMEMREVRHTGENSKEHETNPPLWCRCGQCHPMPSLQEQLCCRRSAGHCISTSATFSRLVLDRQTLESVLLYRGPLLDLSQAHTSTKWLRHCAYSQYTQWRFGDVEPGSYAVIPSCSVWKIRERYPSVEGQYTGLCCEKRVLIKHDQGDK